MTHCSAPASSYVKRALHETKYGHKKSCEMTAKDSNAFSEEINL